MELFINWGFVNLLSVTFFLQILVSFSLFRVLNVGDNPVVEL